MLAALAEFSGTWPMASPQSFHPQATICFSEVLSPIQQWL